MLTKLDALFNRPDIFLPIALLVLSFVLKLTIDVVVGVPKFIQALCELPADMMFLAISFLVAFTIADKTHSDVGLQKVILFMAITAIVIVIWKKSLDFFLKRKFFVWILLLSVNFFVATASVYLSTQEIVKKAEGKASVKNNSVQFCYVIKD